MKNCPKCGYSLGDSDDACPRCVRKNLPTSSRSRLGVGIVGLLCLIAAILIFNSIAPHDSSREPKLPTSTNQESPEDNHIKQEDARRDSYARAFMQELTEKGFDILVARAKGCRGN